jgi:hypothetical protein
VLDRRLAALRDLPCSMLIAVKARDCEVRDGIAPAVALRPAVLERRSRRTLPRKRTSAITAAIVLCRGDAPTKPTSIFAVQSHSGHTGEGRGPDGPGLNALSQTNETGSGLDTDLRRYDGNVASPLASANPASGPRAAPAPPRPFSRPASVRTSCPWPR